MTEPWLDRFLARQFLVPHAAGRCVRLTLLHMGGKYLAVSNWEYPQPVDDDDDVEKIGTEILEAAQQDANTRGGRQRYTVCAYYAGAPAVAAESKAFLKQGVSAEGEDAEVEADSEGPSPIGLQVQTMRHLEAVMRLAVVGQEQIQKAQSRTIEAQNARLATTDARYLDMLRLTEDLATQKHERELATKESEVKVRMWEEGLEKAKLLLPIAVNSMAKQRLLPEPVSPAMEMAGSLVGSITREQFGQLATILTPEQLAVVITLHKQRQALLAAPPGAQPSAPPEAIPILPPAPSNGSDKKAPA